MLRPDQQENWCLYPSRRHSRHHRRALLSVAFDAMGVMRLYRWTPGYQCTPGSNLTSACAPRLSETWSSPPAAFESGNTRYATCSTASTTFGATAYDTSPNVPRRVETRLGRSASASTTISAASSGVSVGNAS